MTWTIDAQHLTRTFGATRAVDELDLRVERGEVFGLIGPNGAGKTTTIRMLTTLLAPTGGTARVCGFDISTQAREVRRRIGYVMQKIAWRGFLTGRESVEVEAALYHVPRAAIRQRAEQVLEMVGMMPHADRMWTEYSGGMQKRLDLACGLLHKPELLVLDEPSLGLDVQSRHRVWEYIRGLQAEGVTILLATNYLDEADRLCDRITIIDEGRAVVSGSPAELKRAVGADVVQVSTSAPQRFREAIAGQRWVKEIVDGESGDVHIYVEDASVAMPALMRLSVEQGIDLARVTYSQPTLDDVFLLHTGRELREQEVSA
jgi:daunorubicin resistance ABC transporter ATP-binding subunit